VSHSQDFVFNMEFENGDQALFNSSTEFLVTFDSAEDTKPDQLCQDSSGEKIAADETLFAEGQPIKTADSEQIVCEFTDDGADWFSPRNTGAGESANAVDVWQSLTSCAATDIHNTGTDESSASKVLPAGDGNSERFADRKSEYVKHGIDISSEFSVVGDNATDAAEVTLPKLVDTSYNMPTDEYENEAVQFSASIFPVDQQLTDERNSIQQDNDMFSDLTAVSNNTSENTKTNETFLIDAGCNKLGEADHNQFSEPFPDSENFIQQPHDGEQNSVMQDGDLFADFRAISYCASENTDLTQTLVVDTQYMKTDDAVNSQHVHLFEPFPDSANFVEQHNVGERDSIKQDNDVFADFTAVTCNASEFPIPTQTVTLDTDCRKLDDANNVQSVQFHELFPDSDNFSQYSDESQLPSVLVPTTAALSDQQLVGLCDEVLFEKREINTSLPDVHKSAINRDFISEFSDQLFLEETSTDTVALKSELSQPAVDVHSAITIDEIQVCYYYILPVSYLYDLT